MNIHHLELFYYVAKYCGIAAAVHNMPYGIHDFSRLQHSLGAGSCCLVKLEPESRKAPANPP